jgi:hypothetical protein
MGVNAIGLRSRCLRRKFKIFLAFERKKKSFMVDLPQTCVSRTSRLPFIPPMASTPTSNNAPNVPGAAISSNFDRRVHAVGGCREFRISPEEASEWLRSSVNVIADSRDQRKYFPAMQITFMCPCENQLTIISTCQGAFSLSGLTSIHLPASVPVIGESCFSDCRSLVSITFDPASQLQKIRRNAFYRVPDQRRDTLLLCVCPPRNLHGNPVP